MTDNKNKIKISFKSPSKWFNALFFLIKCYKNRRKSIKIVTTLKIKYNFMPKCNLKIFENSFK